MAILDKITIVQETRPALHISFGKEIPCTWHMFLVGGDGVAYALIEYINGEVTTVDATHIKFTDVIGDFPNPNMEAIK